MFSFRNAYACARCASMFRCVSLKSFISTEPALGCMLLGNETRLCRFIFNIVTSLNTFQLAPVRPVLLILAQSASGLPTDCLPPYQPCVWPPSCRRALWWSAGSCSVTLASWREDPALSWPCAPESGPKRSSRWELSLTCTAVDDRRHQTLATGSQTAIMWFHTAVTVSSAFVMVTLRVITFNAISINTSCADFICTGKWCVQVCAEYLAAIVPFRDVLI